jgi:UDPglucose 6-dehydrogenase
MSDTHHVTVVGAGYVGLATAIGLAMRGHTVDLIEVRPDRLEALRGGSLPVHEPGMDAAFADPALRARIHPSATVPEGPSDLVLICVGTPVGDDGRSDLRQLRSALKACRPLVEAGVPLVIRSTLPAGSNDEVVRWAGCETGRLFTNPEFLAEGRALEDFLDPSRVVIGTFPEPDPDALALVEGVLGYEGRPLLVVSVAEADLIKNGSNAYLALKLSYANELAVLCEELGADVMNVLEGIGLDPRLGRRYMHPGFGFGGSCLPKDLRSITNVGRDLGWEMHVTSAAANEAHQRRFARRVMSCLPPGCTRVALLGLAFKAGSDDVRASPALRVAELLIARGLEVVGYDPHAAANAVAAVPELRTAASAEEALAGAGVAVIGTEWPEFVKLDWAAIRPRMAAPTILDGRRLLDGPALRALGYRYEAVGAPPDPASLATPAGGETRLPRAARTAS